MPETAPQLTDLLTPFPHPEASPSSLLDSLLLVRLPGAFTGCSTTSSMLPDLVGLLVLNAYCFFNTDQSPMSARHLHNQN